MSRHIEFTTSPQNRHTEFSLGSPVHDGKLPTRFRELQGVRADGEPVLFADETVPDLLHRALVDGRRLKWRGQVFDCVGFVALMHGIELRGPEHNPFVSADETREITPFDRSVNGPVDLGVRRRSGFCSYRHTLAPAHLEDKASYLHKLGDNGPVCLSGLLEAMDIYNCNIAHPAVLEAPASLKP